MFAIETLPANTTNCPNANKNRCRFPAEILLDIFKFVEIKDFPPIVLSSSKIHGIAFIRLEKQQKLLGSDHAECALQAEGIKENQNALKLANLNERDSHGWLPKENRGVRIMQLEWRYIQLTSQLNRTEKKLKQVNSLISSIQK
ncbi:hypothetical protein DdX_19387 [Ditylenchus destructor]|uniref:F-box domain-containing protein n=1 Tax=Ditylenchus destructor TaxID=166010 RepID=A0AAD4MN99_9BILA|nr:hypothetical protein DdX_19387 [Ditylenchus destructor]